MDGMIKKDCKNLGRYYTGELSCSVWGKVFDRECKGCVHYNKKKVKCHQCFWEKIEVIDMDEGFTDNRIVTHKKILFQCKKCKKLLKVKL